MKFLLVVTMLIGSVFAQANDGVKCFDKNGNDLELAYIIKPWEQIELASEKYKLFECDTKTNDAGCDFAGVLKKVERQDENCLVKIHHGSDDMKNSSWSLCLEEQETFDRPRLVPVTVTDDRQEGRIYCERGIKHILR